jgi:hypothetical protein
VIAAFDENSELDEPPETSDRPAPGFRGHDGIRASRYPLTDAGFDSAGLRIVTASLIGTARIYRCGVCGSLEDLLRTARAHVTRGLTPAERREFLGE